MCQRLFRPSLTCSHTVTAATTAEGTVSERLVCSRPDKVKFWETILSLVAGSRGRNPPRLWSGAESVGLSICGAFFWLAKCQLMYLAALKSWTEQQLELLTSLHWRCVITLRDQCWWPADEKSWYVNGRPFGIDWRGACVTGVTDRMVRERKSRPALAEESSSDWGLTSFISSEFSYVFWAQL